MKASTWGFIGVLVVLVIVAVVLTVVFTRSEPVAVDGTVLAPPPVKEGRALVHVLNESHMGKIVLLPAKDSKHKRVIRLPAAASASSKHNGLILRPQRGEHVFGYLHLHAGASTSLRIAAVPEHGDVVCTTTDGSTWSCRGKNVGTARQLRDAPAPEVDTFSFVGLLQDIVGGGLKKAGEEVVESIGEELLDSLLDDFGFDFMPDANQCIDYASISAIVGGIINSQTMANVASMYSATAAFYSGSESTYSIQKAQSLGMTAPGTLDGNADNNLMGYADAYDSTSKRQVLSGMVSGYISSLSGGALDVLAGLPQPNQSAMVTYAAILALTVNMYQELATVQSSEFSTSGMGTLVTTNTYTPVANLRLLGEIQSFVSQNLPPLQQMWSNMSQTYMNNITIEPYQECELSDHGFDCGIGYLIVNNNISSRNAVQPLPTPCTNDRWQLPYPASVPNGICTRPLHTASVLQQEFDYLDGTVLGSMSSLIAALQSISNGAPLLDMDPTSFNQGSTTNVIWNAGAGTCADGNMPLGFSAYGVGIAAGGPNGWGCPSTSTQVYTYLPTTTSPGSVMITTLSNGQMTTATAVTPSSRLIVCQDASGNTAMATPCTL